MKLLQVLTLAGLCASSFAAPVSSLAASGDGLPDMGASFALTENSFPGAGHVMASVEPSPEPSTAGLAIAAFLVGALMKSIGERRRA